MCSLYLWIQNCELAQIWGRDLSLQDWVQVICFGMQGMKLDVLHLCHL